MKLHVLNDDQVIIDAVHFLGSTLWTNFAPFGEAGRFFAMQTARQGMTDFSIIQYRHYLVSEALEKRI